MADHTAVPTAANLRILDEHNGVIVESATGRPLFQVLNPYSPRTESRKHDDFVEIHMERETRQLAALCNSALRLGCDRAISILTEAANPIPDTAAEPAAPVLFAYSCGGCPITGEVYVMQIAKDCTLTRTGDVLAAAYSGDEEHWDSNTFPDLTDDGQRKFVAANGDIVLESGIVWSPREWKVQNPAEGVYTVWVDGTYHDHADSEDAAYEIVAEHVNIHAQAGVEGRA